MNRSVGIRKYIVAVAASIFLAVPAHSQDVPYDQLVAQAQADLNAGRATKALAESQKAVGMDAGRWEAYVVAGGALEIKHNYAKAVEDFTQALERAPAAKKAAVAGLLEKCVKAQYAAHQNATPIQIAETENVMPLGTAEAWISANSPGGTSVAFDGMAGQSCHANIRVYIFKSSIKNSIAPDASKSLDKEKVRAYMATQHSSLAIDDYAVNIGAFDPTRITVTRAFRDWPATEPSPAGTYGVDFHSPGAGTVLVTVFEPDPRTYANWQVQDMRLDVGDLSLAIQLAKAWRDAIVDCSKVVQSNSVPTLSVEAPQR